MLHEKTPRNTVHHIQRCWTSKTQKLQNLEESVRSKKNNIGKLRSYRRQDRLKISTMKLIKTVRVIELQQTSINSCTHIFNFNIMSFGEHPNPGQAFLSRSLLNP